MRGQFSKFPKFIGVGSSYSKKDALTPLAPFASPPSSLPQRKRRLPWPIGSHPAKWRPPLWLAPSPLLATGLAASDSPLRSYCPCGRLSPLAGTVGLPCGLALAAAGRPLAGGLDRGLAMGGWPCMRAGCPSSSLPSM
ncbi:hypothetical protein B296_00015622 [Ensete ventricosum]|uniref:Uncharacterized protein n=1 Tax=Ensete ventricosum TaxID=4639 RepID=A0A426YNU9_ENSVE|nr:hypothetical protein B296_00015622 [Ensete ventricosum]